MTGNTDPYTYPGTNVLRNLRGIRDPLLLARFEAESSTRRIAELIRTPLPGRFDAKHVQAIHRSIFQDIYSWAGEFRTVQLAKDGHSFGAAAFIDSALHSLLAKLRAEALLKHVNIDTFARRAGFYLGEINAVHPFREGNGRTQREFIRELGLQAGFTIAWSHTTQEQMTTASHESFATGNSSRLAALIRSCIA
jgi:cell filamentation protein